MAARGDAPTEMSPMSAGSIFISGIAVCGDDGHELTLDDTRGREPGRTLKKAMRSSWTLMSLKPPLRARCSGVRTAMVMTTAWAR